MKQRIRMRVTPSQPAHRTAGPHEKSIIMEYTSNRRSLGLTEMIRVVSPAGANGHPAPRILTVLPHEIMGGGPQPISCGGLQPIGWDRSAKILRDIEGGRTGKEVVVHPGGHIEVLNDDALDDNGPVTGTLTVLPREIMAADRPYITATDLAVLRSLDPANVEGWTPVRMTDLDGWRFSMQSHPAGPNFVFVALRSPYESNAWRLVLVEPKVDKMGHEPHIVTARINADTTVPVLCLARGARPAADLTELRAQAAKWCLYTTRRLFGQDPIFSK